MPAKYYTRFLLRSGTGTTDEYSGVVELQYDVDRVLESREIEKLLAKNFERDESEVELLNWSRVH